MNNRFTALLIPFVLSAGAEKYFGPPTAVGNGEARLQLEADGNNLLELSLNIKSAALHSLPARDTEYIIQFPANLTAPPFTFMGFNWRPNGHGPVAYAIPHFDVHFYTIPLETQRQMTCQGEEADECIRRPSPE